MQTNNVTQCPVSISVVLHAHPTVKNQEISGQQLVRTQRCEREAANCVHAVHAQQMMVQARRVASLQSQVAVLMEHNCKIQTQLQSLSEERDFLKTRIKDEHQRQQEAVDAKLIHALQADLDREIQSCRKNPSGIWASDNPDFDLCRRLCRL